MSHQIAVVDLFAGPGGLGEGFSSLRDMAGNRLFQIALSIEKDEHAHRTLRLRAFARQFALGRRPEEYYAHIRNREEVTWEDLRAAFPEQVGAAEAEACRLELGTDTEAEASQRVRDALDGSGTWILIGGPPCQAYSLAGRSRRAGEAREDFEKDPRHTLYRHYLRIVDEFEPPVFVMENVTGLLSARLGGRPVFDLIRADFAGAGGSGYTVHSFCTVSDAPGQLEPRDFVLRSEDYGIPQARHRVILLGIRNGSNLATPRGLTTRPRCAVQDVLDGMPRLRSAISRRGRLLDDSASNWLSILDQTAAALERAGEPSATLARIVVNEVLAQGIEAVPGVGEPVSPVNPAPSAYDWWYRSEADHGGITNHQARAHMPSDIQRYFFGAVYAQATGRSPLLEDFPAALLPRHANVAAGVLGTHFADRFRVQVGTGPGTTVTSHISKDGNYYIHYDPAQARSLSVREAARLQTFPDDYFFEGNKTQQYHQVGNAVPPLLARQLAEVVAGLFGRESEPAFPEV